MCACNLLAFHLETALSEECAQSRKFAAKARINSLLAYFTEAGESWQMAKWTLRVAEWVVKRADLRMDFDFARTADSLSEPNECPRTFHSDEYESSTNMNRTDLLLAPFFGSDSLFTFGETIPDHWLEDLFSNDYQPPDTSPRL